MKLRRRITEKEKEKKEVAAQSYQSVAGLQTLASSTGEKYLRRGHTGDCGGNLHNLKGRETSHRHPTKPGSKPQKEPLRHHPLRQAGFYPVTSRLSLAVLIKY